MIRLSNEQQVTGAAWLLALCVAGYPLVGALAAVLGWPSRWASLPFRLVVAAISLGLAMQTWHSRRLSGWAWALFAWFGIYAIRLSHNVIEEYPGAQHELFFFFFTVVLPVVAFVKSDGAKVGDLAGRPIAILAVATLALAIGGESLGLFGAKSLTFTGRLSLVTVNPIALGHLSVTLLLACIVLHAYGTSRYKAQALIFAVLGLAGLSLSGSRGPLVALLVVLLVWFMRAPLQGPIRRSSRMFAIALAGISLLQQWYPLPIDHLTAQSFRARTEQDAKLTGQVDSEELVIITKQRLTGIHQEQQDRIALADESMAARIKLISAAWHAAWENPVFGAPNWKVNHGEYPHNLILEAFQNIGVLGGTVFVGLLMACAYRAFDWLRGGSPLVPLLFMQSAVGSQFSGSLYGYAALWVTSALLLGCDDRSHHQKTI